MHNPAIPRPRGAYAVEVPHTRDGRRCGCPHDVQRHHGERVAVTR